MYQRYLWYVLRHKWFVFLAARKWGIPWKGITHDLSKFRPSEFIPYARYFYGDYPSTKDVHGDRRNWEPRFKEDVERDFDAAWLKHQHRSPHHWQYWILREDDGGTKLINMPEKYRYEMLADWIGAGRALGKPDTAGWWLANRHKMQLPIDLQNWIDAYLVWPIRAAEKRKAAEA